MPVWTLIVWMVLGAVSGLLAPKLLGGKSPFGLTGDVLLGVVGAVAGGYGMSMYGSATVGVALLSFAVAVGGAFAILWALRQLKKTA